MYNCRYEAATPVDLSCVRKGQLKMTINSFEQSVSPEIENFFYVVNQLNAQIGVYDASLLEQARKLRKEEMYLELKNQIMVSSSGAKTTNDDSHQKKVMTRSEILVWIANRLTKIMYVLHDMGLVLGRNTLAYSESRLEMSELGWLIESIESINVPEAEAPLMPIGNIPSTQCFVTVNLCQQTMFHLRTLAIAEDQFTFCLDYLSHLEKLLLLFARLSNRILNDREWFWEPINSRPQSGTRRERSR